MIWRRVFYYHPATDALVTHNLKEYHYPIGRDWDSWKKIEDMKDVTGEGTIWVYVEVNEDEL